MLRRTVLAAGLAGVTAPAWAQAALENFTPSNALERTFVAALDDVSLRPAFRRQFLENQVLMAQRTAASDSPPLLRETPAGDAAMIFTSAALMNTRLSPEAPRIALSGRAALERVQGGLVVINPGFAPMLVLDAESIAAFLEIPATLAGPTQ